MTKNNAKNVDIFFQLTKRHLLVFFGNKVRVMYTLLVPVIIFVVYIFFLRDLEMLTIQNELIKIGIADDAKMWHYCQTLVDSWMISGIIGLSTITVALQANTIIVEDKQNGVNRDFASSPIHKNVLISSYFFYNFIVTALVCFVFFLICLIYLAVMGEFLITFANVMTVFAVMLYSTVSATLMTVFVCSFVKTEGTMMSIVAVFSTAVGFLIGAYMPLGMLPVWVQGICGFIPGTYSCALLRYGFMATPLNDLTAYVTGVLQIENAEELIGTLTSNFGYNLNFFGTTVSAQFQSLAIAIFIIAFLALNIGVGNNLATVLGMGKKRKKKKNTSK
ncbi:MAG: ABC transporter permease [Clostridiales bacterium]|nr:ABC transporter permease [Clostridiales bacterium]